MERRDLLKGLAIVVGGSVVKAGQKVDINKQLIVNVKCDECGWKTRFPLKLSEYGFYQASEACCPECFTLLDQTVTYDENPSLETPKQKKERRKKELEKAIVDQQTKMQSHELQRMQARLDKLNGFGK